MKKNRHESNARLNEREMLIVKYLISNVVCLKLKNKQKNYDKVVEVADVFTPIWLIRGTNAV